MIKMLQSVVLLAAVAWGCYRLGESIDPEHSVMYSAIGALITVVALILMSVQLSQRGQILVVAMMVLSVPLVFGSMLASYPWMWGVLCIVNFPVYLWIARQFYTADNEFLFSLSNIFNGDLPQSQSQEEAEAGYKGLFYLAVCTAVLTAEYKVIVNFLD